MNLDQMDRRLFLRGLTLTSAGLVVPLPVISVPKPVRLPARFQPMNWGAKIIIPEEVMDDERYVNILEAAKKLKWHIDRGQLGSVRDNRIHIPRGTYNDDHPVLGPLFRR